MLKSYQLSVMNQVFNKEEIWKFDRSLQVVTFLDQAYAQLEEIYADRRRRFIAPYLRDQGRFLIYYAHCFSEWFYDDLPEDLRPNNQLWEDVERWSGVAQQEMETVAMETFWLKDIRQHIFQVLKDNMELEFLTKEIYMRMKLNPQDFHLHSITESGNGQLHTEFQVFAQRLYGLIQEWRTSVLTTKSDFSPGQQELLKLFPGPVEVARQIDETDQEIIDLKTLVQQVGERYTDFIKSASSRC